MAKFNLNIKSINKNYEKSNINGLIFEEEISKGSTAIVYRGLYKDKKVAIKKFNNYHEFNRELTSINQIKAYDIPVIKPIIIFHEKLLIVYKFYNKSLLTSIKNKDPWISDKKKVIKLFITLFNNLSIIHLFKFSHKDIKPDNILLDEKYNEIIPIIGDIGLFNNFNYLSPVGTKLYLPPEFHGSFITISCKDNLYKQDVWALSLTALITINYWDNILSSGSDIKNKIGYIKNFKMNSNHIPPGFEDFCNILKNGLKTNPNQRFTSKDMYNKLLTILR